MPPKKKPKNSKEKEKKISTDAQWCLDSVEALDFKKFIEHFGCLNRNQAQTRYGRVLKIISTGRVIGILKYKPNTIIGLKLQTIYTFGMCDQT